MIIEYIHRLSCQYLSDLVRMADLKKTFSKSDTTNWSYILHKVLEIINGTIPAYKLDNLKER